MGAIYVTSSRTAAKSRTRSRKSRSSGTKSSMRGHPIHPVQLEERLAEAPDEGVITGRMWAGIVFVGVIMAARAGRCAPGRPHRRFRIPPLCPDDGVARRAEA